jgi:hypothetical protein
VSARRVVALVLALTLAARPASAGVPKWLVWAALGVAAGVTASNYATSAHHLRAEADALRYTVSTGDFEGMAAPRVVFAVPDLTYLQPIRDRVMAQAASLDKRADRRQHVATALAVVSIAAAGMTITTGAHSFMVRRTVRFGGQGGVR